MAVELRSTVRGKGRTYLKRLIAVLRTGQGAGLLGQPFELPDQRLEIDGKGQEIVQKQPGFNAPDQQDESHVLLEQSRREFIRIARGTNCFGCCHRVQALEVL